MSGFDRWVEVKGLRQQGWSIRKKARGLEMDRGTVRKIHRSLCPAPDGGPGAGDGLSFIGLLAPQPAYEVAKGNPSPGKQFAILVYALRDSDGSGYNRRVCWRSTKSM